RRGHGGVLRRGTLQAHAGALRRAPLEPTALRRCPRRARRGAQLGPRRLAHRRRRRLAHRPPPAGEDPVWLQPPDRTPAAGPAARRGPDDAQVLIMRTLLAFSLLVFTLACARRWPPAPTAWREVTSAPCAFTVRMPGRPKTRAATDRYGIQVTQYAVALRPG